MLITKQKAGQFLIEFTEDEQHKLSLLSYLTAKNEAPLLVRMLKSAVKLYDSLLNDVLSIDI